MKYIMFILILCINTFATDTVNVAVSNFEPIVFEKNGKLVGYEIDLLNKVSSELDIKFKFINKNEFKDIFTSLDSNEARIGSAGITINEVRNEKYDFSYPHIKTGMSILIKNESVINISSMLFNLFSDNLMTFIMYIGYLLFASLMVYLFELGSDAFNDNFIKGMFEAFYYTNTTATTVGYGDFAPKRVITRIFAMIFLFYPSIVFSGIIIGTITSSINLSSSIYSINDKDDLTNITIGAIKNTTSYYISKSLSKSVVAIDRKDCVEMLQKDYVKAIIFDDVYLSNIAKNNKKFTTVGKIFHKEDYGFMFKENDPLKKEFDKIIIKFMSDGTLEELNNKWFGE